MDTFDDHIFCPCVRVLAFRTSKLNVRISGAASFTIYSGTKENFRNNNILCRDNIVDTSLTGGISGAMSGALISFGSARMYPAFFQVSCSLLCLPAFELVKVRHRLLFKFIKQIKGFLGSSTIGVCHCCNQRHFLGEAPRHTASRKGNI